MLSSLGWLFPQNITPSLSCYLRLEIRDWTAEFDYQSRFLHFLTRNRPGRSILGAVSGKSLLSLKICNAIFIHKNAYVLKYESALNNTKKCS